MRTESGDERRKIYNDLVREEISNIKPQVTGRTGGQISAARGRATRRFLKMGF